MWREIKIYKCNNNNSNAVEKTSALCQTLSSLDVKKIMTGNWKADGFVGKSTFELNIKCANFWLGWSSNPFFIPWNFVTFRTRGTKTSEKELRNWILSSLVAFSLSAIFDLRFENRCSFSKTSDLIPVIRENTLLCTQEKTTKIEPFNWTIPTPHICLTIFSHQFPTNFLLF